MATNESDHFATHAAAVARQILGEPNKALSSRTELRFGNHGSLSVDVAKGTFFDHSAEEGGGVLWFIARQTGRAGREAVEWMRENGYYIEDRGEVPHSGHADGRASGQGGARPASRNDPAGNWLPPSVPDHGRQTAVYDYREADGTLRYQVVRFDWDDPSSPKGHGKTFLQRKPDASKRNGFSWKVKGTEPLPYRLPELLEDIADGAEIFIVEGEKKADMLREIGVPATCNSGGAGKFPDEIVNWFKGAKVTILADNDQPGLEHRGLVGNKLLAVAARVRTLDLPGLPAKGGVDDWLPAGGSAEKLYAEAAMHAKPFNAVPFVSKFNAVTWLDFDKPGPVYDQLIKGVLTKGELSFLLGESQSGKSFLAISIAMAVARGVDWFGHRVRRGGVIYQAGESAVGVRRRRFPAYRKHYEVAHEPLPVVLLQSPLDLYSSDDPTEAFIEECKQWARTFDVPLELIVIDTFNKATPGANENDGKDMGLVLARCDRIRKETGAHVMLVHHLNAVGNKARGHTSLFANVENVLLCKIVPDHTDADGRKVREVTISKQKDGEDGVSIRFVLPQVDIGQDEDGDRITSCIVAPPSGQANAPLPSSGAVQLGSVYAKVMRVLYELLGNAAHFHHAPPELNLPQGARVVLSRALSARFAETEKPENFDDLSEDDKQKERDRIRQAIKRSRDALYSKGIIGMNEEYVWATGKPVMGFGPPPGVAPRRSPGSGALPPEAAEPPPPDAFNDLPFDDDYGS